MVGLLVIVKGSGKYVCYPDMSKANLRPSGNNQIAVVRNSEFTLIWPRLERDLFQNGGVVLCRGRSTNRTCRQVCSNWTKLLVYEQPWNQNKSSLRGIDLCKRNNIKERSNKPALQHTIFKSKM